MGYVSGPTDLTGYAQITSGGYVGNSTVNRAIAHGLGITPKLVLIIRHSSTSNWFGIFHAGQIISTNTFYNIVTGRDTTNFYVGNAADYGNTANVNSANYTWVAIG